MLGTVMLGLSLLVTGPVISAAADDSTLIRERWFTDRIEPENIDSVAVWHGPDGQHWLLATAKEGHRLHLYDARNGATLDVVGEPGDGPGQFKRPQWHLGG